MDKAGILLRVSTAAQAEGDRTSLASQEATARDRMAKEGIPVARVYVEPGHSGGNYYARPILQQALADLERGDFNVFVIAFSSRFSRKGEYQHLIRQRIHDAGGRFIWCDLGEIDEDDPNSKFVATIKNAADELDWGLIRKGCMKGKRDAAQAGRQPARTFAPYGYHIAQKNDVIRGTYPPGSEGKYFVREEEARHARAVFAWYAGGKTITEITHLLKEAGAPTRKGGEEWARRSVMNILTNTVYKGQATFGAMQSRTDDKRVLQGLKPQYKRAAPDGAYITIDVPALVNESVWESCQEKRDENRKCRSGAPRLRYLLTGFSYCANCGRKLHLEAWSKEKRTPRYRCSVNVKHSEKAIGGCNVGTIYHQEPSDRLVVQAVAALATSREVVAAAVEMFNRKIAGDEERETARARVRQLESRAADVGKKRQAAVHAQIKGLAAGIDTDVYEAVLLILQAEARTIEGELAAARQAAQNGPAHVDPTAVASFVSRSLASVEAILMSDAIPINEKNAVLCGIVDRVFLERSPTIPGIRTVHPGAASVWLKPLFEGGEGLSERRQLCAPLKTAA